MTESNVQPFEFRGNPVATVTAENGTVLFCAKHVATALGYSNTRDAIAKHCKGVANRYPLETAGGIQQMVFITDDKRMNCDTVYGILRGAGYIELRSKAPTVKAVKPGYLKPVMSRKANGKLDRQYARFTAKGVNWFIDRFIYGRSQGRLPGVA